MSDRVTQYDNFRYLVRSYGSGPIENERQYLVDIAEFDWIGQCDCPHWITRLGPKIRQGERLRCKHVVAAREAALDDIGRKLQIALGERKVKRNVQKHIAETKSVVGPGTKPTTGRQAEESNSSDEQ